MGWGPQSNYKPGGGGVNFVSDYFSNPVNQKFRKGMMESTNSQ